MASLKEARADIQSLSSKDLVNEYRRSLRSEIAASVDDLSPMEYLGRQGYRKMLEAELLRRLGS